MKLVMDDKLKHRLVGVLVILSLAAIFLPAMMKKSSQRLEHSFNVNVQLPPKPTAPHVAVVDKEQMFNTIKVAKAENLPALRSQIAMVVPAATEKTHEAVSLNKASHKIEHKTMHLASNKPGTKLNKPIKTIVVAAKNKVLAKTQMNPVAKKDIYAVQLASFSELTRARTLVKKLEQKGYKASYTRTTNKKSVVYKVYAGHSPNENRVVKLKTQLASAMRLEGFVVNTGVS